MGGCYRGERSPGSHPQELLAERTAEEPFGFLRMHHLGIGARHINKRTLAIADNTTVTVIELDTAEVLSTHLIEPNKSYWRNTQRAPGRWPGAL